MASNRIIPRIESGFIEVIIDGYEDWESATQTIEEVVAIVDRTGTGRILYDFTTADMRMARSEGPDVSRFGGNLAQRQLDVGVVPARDDRSREIVEASFRALDEMGHRVRFITSDEERETWVRDGMGVFPKTRRGTSSG
jgi:hypothetical protein